MCSEKETKNKLDWMYKGANGLVDREEYLLGRKIDKTLEQINEEEKHKEYGIVQPKNHVEHECIPPSIRDYRLQVGEQVDLATKLQEDPLVVIKKREEETRRQFLQNPIQLKKLQRALSKHTKKKKKQYDDLDLKIAEKLQALKGDSSDDLDMILLHKLDKLKNKLSRNDLKEILEWKNPTVSTSSDSDDEKHTKRATNFKRNVKANDPSRSDTKAKRLSEAEKERMRREMMQNATWRDKERTKNVKRYNDEQSRETKQAADYNTDFIRKELLKSANSSSLESRIKSNINSIQRSGNDMNKHFSRRN